MIIYFAATEDFVRRYKSDLGVSNFLIAYPALKNPKVFGAWLKYAGLGKNKHKDKKIFLDSGAFSAFNSGMKITFYEYLDFVERFHKYFDYVATLDVIRDPEASMQNYKDMLRAGYNTIPAWHYPEPVEWFDKYCKMTDYVAIGGIAKMCFKNPNLIARLIGKMVERKPKDVKLHVYGIASKDVITRYGSFIESVDTTGWLTGASFNVVLERHNKFYPQSDHYDSKLWRPGPKHIDRVALYNIRKYQEIEQDINHSINYQQKYEAKVKVRR